MGKKAKMTKCKAWLLAPDCDSIKVIDVDVDGAFKPLYELLHCDQIEYLGFTHQDSSYGIYMDECGAMKNLPRNKCAKKLLGKVKGVLWGTFTGWYLVFKMDYDGNQDLMDMDITPREFVDNWNYVLNNRQNCSLMKTLNMS